MAFDYAMLGDNVPLMELFQRGEASPFDRDDNGKNLLFVRIESLWMNNCVINWPCSLVCDTV